MSNTTPGLREAAEFALDECNHCNSSFECPNCGSYFFGTLNAATMAEEGQQVECRNETSMCMWQGQIDNARPSPCDACTRLRAALGEVPVADDREELVSNFLAHLEKYVDATIEENDRGKEGGHISVGAGSGRYFQQMKETLLRLVRHV